MNKVLRIFLLSISILFFVLGSIYQIASAEPVLIHARSGQQGHGWLFGAPQDGQSWIVTPAHVVASPETGELEPFSFGDGQGVFGECAKPIRVIDSKIMMLADKEGKDLAFARVISGRPDGKCRSRLGLTTLGYQAAMMKTQGFIVVSRFQTSASEQPLTLARHSVDSFGGAVIDFKPLGAAPDGFMRKGLSGAPVITEIGGQNVPVAMVLSINSESDVLRTLRFDYIKERYNQLRSKEDGAISSQACLGDIPYQILNTSYVPIDGDLGVSTLQQANGCWSAAAPKGQKTVDVVLAVSEPGRKISSIEIIQNASCGSSSLHFWVDQRIEEAANWEYVTSFERNIQESSVCRIGLTTPRLLRIRFDARDSVFISGIRLQ